MKSENNFNILDCIDKIYNHSQDSQLGEALFETLKEDLTQFSQYLEVPKTQALIFANTFLISFESKNFIDVFKHFGLKYFHILKYRKEIEQLFHKNLLNNNEVNKKKIGKFSISEALISKISKNEPINSKVLEKISTENTIDILYEFDSLKEEFKYKNVSLFEFREYIDNLCFENKEMPLFKEIRNYRLDNFETFYLLDSILDNLKLCDNDFNTDVSYTIDIYYQQKSLSLSNLKRFLNKETKLSKLKLIEFSEGNFGNKTKSRLSPKILKFLKENENITFDEVTQNNRKLIICDSIPKKQLFYNDHEISQIEILKNVLEDTRFMEMQKRLQEKDFSTGITSILHGVSGTGKTETVYQLAKESGRNIFKVDISETKTMWFGESQKLIKKVFTDYENFRKSEKRCPILLFNEADAIIGKRKPAGSSNVSDTENQIQNIILEEMENFSGILFATTNLIENMDEAFERRFLFKIKFEKPNIKNSAKIWKSKLPNLSENESLELAEKFQFSGGEMENIARKCLMNEILNGTKTTFYEVSQFCKQEKWGRNVERKKIGF